MLQTQVLKVEQVNVLYIELTQENLIENSVPECLPYILNNDSLCYLSDLQSLDPSFF